MKCRKALDEDQYDDTEMPSERDMLLPEVKNRARRKRQEKKIELQEEPAIEEEMQRDEEQTPKRCPLPERPALRAQAEEKPEESEEDQDALMEEEEPQLGERPGGQCGAGRDPLEMRQYGRFPDGNIKQNT